jgi:O-antigen ligase
MAPIVVFGNLDEVSEDRGFIRVLQLNSMDVATLCYFVCLHKAVSSSSKKVIWIIISIILFLVILLSLSRIVLLAMIVGTIFYLLKRKAYKTITILMIVGTISFGAILQTDVVSGMIELTKNQAESKSENDFRLIEYQHAFDAYPINPISIVFGNGHSHVASSLGKYDQKLQKRMGYDRVDAGFVGLYATYGLIGVLLIFSIFYKALIKKCASEDLPYKCFIIFLIITNIMAFTIFSYGIAFMIALYMLFKDEPLRIKHSKHSTSLCSI